jgi:4-nitrophenyl phosphatase
MDGVIYRGDREIAEASQTVSQLQRDGRNVYMLTNNSGSSRQQYLQKLSGMGIQIEMANIFTSAYATALYLKAHGGIGKNAFIIGESGIAAELSAAGIITCATPDTIPYTQIDYVIIGIDRKFTYDKLLFAYTCISRGHAQFIATNRDATYPVEDGSVPGAGSIVASVATASGTEPIVIGKPEPHALEAILQAAGASIGETVMIGDRLDTDIAAGKRIGVYTVLVLTGVTTRREAESATSEYKPDKIIDNLSELLET